METIIAVISVGVAALSLLFAIISFVVSYYRNKNKDNMADIVETKTQLTKIQTDIAYIRANLDERKEWEKNIEGRLRRLETSKK